MHNDQLTNFVLTRSEAARREGLEREAQTDRFERCEILGECIAPNELKPTFASHMFSVLRRPLCE